VPGYESDTCGNDSAESEGLERAAEPVDISDDTDVDAVGPVVVFGETRNVTRDGNDPLEQQDGRRQVVPRGDELADG
jgi:hypothetical protein